MKAIENEIIQFIHAMHRCWTEGDPAELSQYFHKDMVGFTPMNRERLEGKDSCLASWKAFPEYAKTYSFEEYDFRVQIYGNTAIVSSYYDMSYGFAGQTIYETGRSIYTLIKEKGKWWLVANQFSPVPEASPWIWEKYINLNPNNFIIKVLNTVHLSFRIFPVDLLIPTLKWKR